jgi:hypothetical protein
LHQVYLLAGATGLLLLLVLLLCGSYVGFAASLDSVNKPFQGFMKLVRSLWVLDVADTYDGKRQRHVALTHVSAVPSFVYGR